MTGRRLPKRYFTIIALAISSVSASAHAVAEAPLQCSVSAMTQEKDIAGVKDTLAAYGAALNGGKTTAVLPLYTEDGTFMAPFSPSAIGKDAVRKAYDAVFNELKFHVKFTIEEVVVMTPNWAFARTNSAGTTDHHSTGRRTAEANQELFIFRKGDDGIWRIARYSFSPINAPSN